MLLSGGRFIYVLNRGVNAEGGSDCTTADPCTGSNIIQFAIGGNGVLSSQETFFTQGLNPFRMFADSSGKFLYVLDHDSPAPGSTTAHPIASSTANPNSNCALALGTGVVACGDITAFQIDPTTGRLTTDRRIRRSLPPAAPRFLTSRFRQIPSISHLRRAMC